MMREGRAIRKTKGLKISSKILVVVFLITIILNNVSPFDNGKMVQATPPSGAVSYTEVAPISWTRTPDVRNEGSYQVNNTRANFNGYFTNTGGNNFILDKKPVTDTSSGIIWVDSLFGTNQYTFDYDMLETLLNPTETNVWDGKGSKPYSGWAPTGYKSRVQKVKDYYGGTIPSSFPDFATWQYSPWNTASNPWKYGDQLRLFKGTFDLSADDLTSYNYFIGVGENKDLILPIDDTIVVLVDEKPVGINYTTDSNSVGKSIKIKNGSTTYDIPFGLTEDIYGWIPGNYKSCNIESHKALTAHTDGLHVHLDKVMTDGKILGEITDVIVESGGTSHKIEILVSDYNLSGGMTKLDIVKVKKPSTSIVKEAYVNESLVSSSEIPTTVGSAKVGETIKYKFKYSNLDETPVYDLEFTDPTLNISITKDAATLNGTELSDLVVTLNKADGAIQVGGKELLAVALKNGESITVESPSFAHKVTSAEAVKGANISNTVSVVGKYYLDVSTPITETTVEVKPINLVASVDTSKEAFADANYLYPITTTITKEKVYYQFKLENTGEVNLNNITFTDNDFNGKGDKVVITKDGIKVNNVAPVTNNLNVKKYKGVSEIDTGVSTLDKLLTLKIGETIVVTDSENVYRDITETSGSLSNTVEGKGSYILEDNLIEAKENAIAIVDVNNPQVSANKIAFTNIATEAQTGVAYPEQNIYYKFQLENTGTQDLKEVSFIDANFNGTDSFMINSGGITINENTPLSDSLKVKKYKNNVEIDTTLTNLDKFKTLNVGEKIEITDTLNLYRKVKIIDQQGTIFNNKVVGNAQYTYGGIDKAVSDSAIVDVTANKQEIAVVKEALVKNKVVASTNNQNKEEVFANQKVEYRLSMTNNGPETIKDVVFNDTTLGVKISKNGIELNGTKVSSLGLQINKMTANGLQVGLESDLATMLSELKVGESIKVTDSLLLNSTPIVEGTLNNTVIGSAKYQNDLQISQEQTVTVPVIDNKNIDIVKTIGKVTRDNEVIYDSSISPVSNIPERFYPGDKVDFNYIINNTGVSTIDNLYLSDVLTNQGIIDVKDWVFTKDGVTFNHEDFSIAAGETINLVTTWTVENSTKKLALNTVDLLKKNPVSSNFESLSKSSVDFMVYPRVYVTMDCGDDTEKQFYVTVTGTDGFKTGMYLKNGNRVELDNLNFDVDYTVTETIPMNYTLTGIDIANGTSLDGEKSKINNLKFSLITAEHPETITVKNEKEDSKQFRDDSEVTNTLKYTK